MPELRLAHAIEQKARGSLTERTAPVRATANGSENGIPFPYPVCEIVVSHMVDYDGHPFGMPFNRSGEPHADRPGSRFRQGPKS